MKNPVPLQASRCRPRDRRLARSDYVGRPRGAPSGGEENCKSGGRGTGDVVLGCQQAGRFQRRFHLWQACANPMERWPGRSPDFRRRLCCPGFWRLKGIRRWRSQIAGAGMLATPRLLTASADWGRRRMVGGEVLGAAVVIPFDERHITEGKIGQERIGINLDACWSLSTA